MRGSNLPPNTNVTHYCQFDNRDGQGWGPSQFPHTVRTNGNGDFTGVGTCHVGSILLRYEVRVNGNNYYTQAVTR